MKRIRGILLTLFCILSIVFLVAIYQLKILNYIYFGIVTGTILLLTYLVVFMLLRGKKKSISVIIFSIIGIILSIVYSIGISYVIHTKDFISIITSHGNEYKTYQVIVPNTSPIQKIKELNNKKIGFLEIDSSYQDSIDKLKKTVHIESNHYNSLDHLMDSLYKNEVDAVSIDKSYMETLMEHDKNFISKVKIIYSYKVYIKSVTNSIENPDIDTSNSFILYISGSDSRSTVRAVARSDVNIIAVVNPNTHKILLVHIPRDYYVHLRGTSGINDKLTHAGVYGIEKSIGTIEDLLSIHIDKYVKVSFATVIQSVDLLDGLDIYSDKSFTAWTNKSCHFVTGTQHVDGKCALAFARERKSYDTGDRHRGENQEQVISLLINKLSNPKYLIRYNDILNATSGSFETSMSYDEMTTLIRTGLGTNIKWTIDSYNLDGTAAMMPTYSMGSQRLYVMLPNQNTIDTAKVKINEYLNG